MKSVKTNAATPSVWKTKFASTDSANTSATTLTFARVATWCATLTTFAFQAAVTQQSCASPDNDVMKKAITFSADGNVQIMDRIALRERPIATPMSLSAECPTVAIMNGVTLLLSIVNVRCSVIHNASLARASIYARVLWIALTAKRATTENV